jgi:hypothetical protein
MRRIMNPILVSCGPAVMIRQQANDRHVAGAELSAPRRCCVGRDMQTVKLAEAPKSSPTLWRSGKGIW